MNKAYISQARSMLAKHLFRPDLKPKSGRDKTSGCDVLEAKRVTFRPAPSLSLQWLLFFGLIWLLAGCGSQAKSEAPVTAIVVEPTSLPARPTSTPTATPTTTAPATATPTATASATVTSIPTAEIDSEAETFYYKGLTYTAAGLPEDAMTNFNQAIALQPDYVLAHLERGKLYMQQGQFDQARSDFHYALELTTDAEVKAEVKGLLQQLITQAANIPLATSTPQMDRITPAPQVTAIIVSGSPVEAQMGQPFAISLGQTARLKEANLTITFMSILEDSRCPSQVNCFWSGQARIMIRVQQGQAEGTTFELNSLLQAKQDTITYAGYQIQFSQIDPYPEDPNQPISPEAYQATFVVTAK